MDPPIKTEATTTVLDGAPPTMARRTAPSIAALLPRLTAPRILADGLPRYRQSFSLPEGDSCKPTRDKDGHPAPPSDSTDRTASAAARYVEWNSLVPSPSVLRSSFGSILPASHGGGTSTSAQQAESGLSRRICAPPPRLVFFGEQHHQPEVLRAQLQVLSALHDRCQRASVTDDASTPRDQQQRGSPRRYRLHLVLEHFSVEDQPILDAFGSGQLPPQGLIDTYAACSEEGFDLSHYMPLLLLARELGVPVWGGFPPRRWARDVFREGIEAVQRSERSWLSSLADAASGAKPRLPKLPKLPNWSMVTSVHAAHRSYLSSLMRPDQPPRFPSLPDGSAAQPLLPAMATLSGSRIYPTWLLRPTASESKGFAPAQALKDSYFAHVAAWLLCGGGGGARADGGAAETGEEHGAEVVNVTLCIAGLGHVEYGHGVPERVLHLLRHPDRPFPQAVNADESAALNSNGDEDLSTIEPYIIASKPADSGVWLGFESSQQKAEPEATLAAQICEHGKSEGYGVGGRWSDDPWQRKLADAVVLYEWRDSDAEGDWP
ncbi:hypothetical protein ACQY0O_004693 [Thecaphora frezii]